MLQASYAADKAGELECTGIEFGRFVEILTQGAPLAVVHVALASYARRIRHMGSPRSSRHALHSGKPGVIELLPLHSPLHVPKRKPSHLPLHLPLHLLLH